MASKKYKGKTCAYCGKLKSSTTGDHIIARGFLLAKHRDNLPAVPACAECNTSKSKLETYLMQVLPLGANHTDAKETSDILMPKRAQNQANTVLRNLLNSPDENAQLFDMEGKAHERVLMYVDANILEDWCGMIACGLAFFHWKIVTPDYNIETIPLTFEKERALISFAERNDGSGYAENTIGNNAFSYLGFRELNHGRSSVWILRLYGRMPIGGDPSVSNALASSWSVFITPPDHT